MRRIRITSLTPGRTCIGLFQFQDGDMSERIVRHSYNLDTPHGWHDHGVPTYVLQRNWCWGFMFSDGTFGMSRRGDADVDAALAVFGLRRAP